LGPTTRGWVEIVNQPTQHPSPQAPSDDPVAAFHQRQQQVESARSQTDRAAVNQQLAF